MVPLSTPHAHTTWVDGRNTAREMIEAAIGKGFQSIGFSEHGVQDFDPDYCLNREKELAYQEEIKKLRDEYRDRIRVRLGVERDAMGTCRREEYEYAIGSMHYFRDGAYFFAVDSSPEDVANGVRRLFDGDATAMVKAYYASFARFLTDFRPDIIGHFDLPTKFNEKHRLFDENAPAYRDAAFACLDAAKESGGLLEINTGAIARGWRSKPYPSLRILKRWKELGGSVILASDCHSAEKLDAGYDIALEAARAAGFRSIMALGCGRTLFEEYGIE